MRVLKVTPYGLVKSVRNTKSWTECGWLYSMTRITNGNRYGIDLLIPPEEMHYRHVVSLKLKQARSELRSAILADKKFT